MATTVSNTVLEISGLAIPVALKKIKEENEPKLERASMDGNKIKRSEADSVTGEIVTESQHGVYNEDGEFVPIAEETLEEITEATKLETIEINNFISVAQVPWDRVEGAYFLAPQRGSSAKPLAVLHAALRRSRKAAVCKLSPRSRQKLAVIHAKEGGIFVAVLSFAADFAQVEEATKALRKVKPDPRAVEAMCILIEALSAEPEVLDEQTDELIPLKGKLIEDALAGRAVTARVPRPLAVVEDAEDMLVEQLERVSESARKGSSRKRGAKEADRVTV